MIYSIQLEENSPQLQKLLSSFQQSKTDFMLSNEVLYINTQLTKEDLTQKIRSLLSKDSMFFLSPITKQHLPKLQSYTKTWVKSILMREEMENKIKQDIEIYNSFLDFCEENFKNGQFLKPPEKEDKTCPKKENPEDQELNQSP